MMHTREERGPSGEMELFYEHRESGGEQRDDHKKVTLKAERGNVVLIEWRSSSTTFKMGQADTREDKYEIKPEQLIELIKTHGTEL